MQMTRKTGDHNKLFCQHMVLLSISTSTWWLYEF